MGSDSDILAAIPHRPPFLWVDTIVSFDGRTIITEKFIDPDLDVFAGHYPGHPVMPGVLLCEAVFQTGALFMARMLQESGVSVETDGKAPLLTRIKNAKFKREVKPGALIRMHVTLDENIGSAWFFKGKVTVADRTAVKVDFGCVLAETGGTDAGS